MGGGSGTRDDSRMTIFSTSNLDLVEKNLSDIDIDQNLSPHKESNRNKYLSLPFKITSEDSGSVSFRSNGVRKWWKSKLGFKKLIKSVHPKGKNKFPLLPLPSESSKFCRESLDLDFSDQLDQKQEKGNEKRSGFNFALGRKNKNYSDKILQTIVDMNDMDAFYKPDLDLDVLTQGQGQDTGRSQLKVDDDDRIFSENDKQVEETFGEAGPDGECRRRRNTTTKSRVSYHNFSTPRQSFSEMKTESESDSSFVICDADAADTDDIGNENDAIVADVANDAIGKNTCDDRDRTDTKDSCHKKIKATVDFHEGTRRMSSNPPDESEPNEGRGDFDAAVASANGNKATLAPKKAPRKNLTNTTTTTTTTVSDNKNWKREIDVDGDIDIDLDRDTTNTNFDPVRIEETETDIEEACSNSPSPKKNKNPENENAEAELISQALNDDEITAKLESFMGDGNNSMNFADIGLGDLDPNQGQGQDRGRIRIPPFLFATAMALLLQFVIVPFFKRLFNPSQNDDNNDNE